MTVAFDTLRPTVQMVADLVRTRTILEGGQTVDTFTSGTYPTGQQVERLIDQATNAIFVQLPGSVSEPWAPAGTHLAALYAAILVEASYYREQLTDDQIQLYRDLLISGIRGLGAAISGGGEEAGAGPGSRMLVDSVVMSSLVSMSPEEMWLRDLGIYELSVIDTEGVAVTQGPISLVPQVTDLELYAGDGASFTVSAGDAAGNPINFSAGALKAQIRRQRADAAPLADFAIAVDPEPGTLTLTLSGAQTASLVVGGEDFAGFWDLQWTPTGQQPTTIVQGKVSCGYDVTRT